MLRVLFLPLSLCVCATVASAQNPQTTVDIDVSALAFARGAVQATVRRKDPPNQTPSPQIRTRVTFAVKGQSPFHTIEALLKPGASQVISVPYPGSGSRVVFSAMALPVAMKEIAIANNSRESIPYSIAAMTRSLPRPRPVAPPGIPLPGERQPPMPRPGNPPNPLPNPSPNPAPPPAPAPAPAPPPADRIPPPATEPPFATISTSELVLVGGEPGTPAVGPSTSGVSVTTPGLVLIGGVQRTPAVGSSGPINIVTPSLILIGRKE